MYEFAAALVTALLLAASYWINHRVVGFLPDDPPTGGRKNHGRPIPLAGIVLLPIVLPWLCVTELLQFCPSVASIYQIISFLYRV